VTPLGVLYRRIELETPDMLLYRTVRQWADIIIAVADQKGSTGHFPVLFPLPLASVDDFSVLDLESDINMGFSIAMQDDVPLGKVQEVCAALRSNPGRVKALAHFELFQMEYWDLLLQISKKDIAATKGILQRLLTGFDDGTFSPESLPTPVVAYFKAWSCVKIIHIDIPIEFESLLEPFVVAVKDALQLQSALLPPDVAHFGAHLELYEARKHYRRLLASNERSEACKLMAQALKLYSDAVGTCDRYVIDYLPMVVAHLEDVQLFSAISEGAVSAAEKFYGPHSLHYLATMVLWTEQSFLFDSKCPVLMRVDSPPSTESSAMANRMLSIMKSIYEPTNTTFLEHLHVYLRFCPVDSVESRAALYQAMKLNHGAGLFRNARFLSLVGRAASYYYFTSKSNSKEIFIMMEKILQDPQWRMADRPYTNIFARFQHEIVRDMATGNVGVIPDKVKYLCSLMGSPRSMARRP
jgi:hypothetical protein